MLSLNIIVNKITSYIYCNFFLRKISSIGRSTMERCPNWGKHLQWQEIMVCVCRWQEWRGRDPWGRGLCSRQIAIAQSIVTPLLYPGRVVICVSLEWKKVVIVLCGWGCVAVLLSFNNFSLCLLTYSKKIPRLRWSSYTITLCK